MKKPMPAKKMTMKAFEKSAMDRKADAKSGMKEGSKSDKAQDKAGLAKMRIMAKPKNASTKKEDTP